MRPQIAALTPACTKKQRQQRCLTGRPCSRAGGGGGGGGCEAETQCDRHKLHSSVSMAHPACAAADSDVQRLLMAGPGRNMSLRRTKQCVENRCPVTGC